MGLLTYSKSYWTDTKVKDNVISRKLKLFEPKIAIRKNGLKLETFDYLGLIVRDRKYELIQLIFQDIIQRIIAGRRGDNHAMATFHTLGYDSRN